MFPQRREQDARRGGSKCHWRARNNVNSRVTGVT